MRQRGDFGLTTMRGTAVGRIIRLGERLNGDGFALYAHAFVFVDDDGGIVEAEPGGARLGNVSEYGDDWVSSNWNLTNEERSLIAVQARMVVGTPYSILDYVALAAHRLHLPTGFLRHYIATSKHMICSQLVDYVYDSSDQTMFSDGRFEGDVTPQDLAAVLNGPLKNGK